MSFTNRIERFDADHGIPRRADEPYLPAYYAFLRCSQDAVQILVLVVFGTLSALFLRIAATYFQLSLIGQLIFLVLAVFAFGIALAEAAQLFVPYHPGRTHGKSYLTDKAGIKQIQQHYLKL